MATVINTPKARHPLASLVAAALIGMAPVFALIGGAF